MIVIFGLRQVAGLFATPGGADALEIEWPD
jgi:hypothetical protein